VTQGAASFDPDLDALWQGFPQRRNTNIPLVARGVRALEGRRVDSAASSR
jgi:hypothetical protein